MKHAYGKMEGHYSTFKKKVEVLLTEQKMSQVERKKWLITLETRLAGYLQKGHQFLEIGITDDS